MSRRKGEMIVYLVCTVLGVMFLVSIGTALYPRPSDFRSWIKVAFNTYGLYCIYQVLASKDVKSGNSLRYIALLSGFFSLFQFLVVGFGLRKALAMGDPINPVNSILWTMLGVMFVIGIIKSLCGAAFWLPSVKLFLTCYHFNGEFNEDH